MSCGINDDFTGIVCFTVHLFREMGCAGSLLAAVAMLLQADEKLQSI
jgi:hypothetical protein